MRDLLFLFFFGLFWSVYEGYVLEWSCLLSKPSGATGDESEVSKAERTTFFVLGVERCTSDHFLMHL